MTVEELMHQAARRLKFAPVCSIFEAVNAVTEMVMLRLLFRRSELLMAEDDALLVFAVGNTKQLLPVDFIELCGHPYLTTSYDLAPLLNGQRLPIKSGEPEGYRVIGGRRLEVWPTPAEEVTIGVPYFAKPAPVAALTDPVPFAEFEQVMVDGCVAAMSVGLVSNAERTVEAMVQQGVDLMLTAKSLAAEQLLADAINGA